MPSDKVTNKTLMINSAHAAPTCPAASGNILPALKIAANETAVILAKQA